jgi:hypothetical protein
MEELGNCGFVTEGLPAGTSPRRSWRGFGTLVGDNADAGPLRTLAPSLPAAPRSGGGRAARARLVARMLHDLSGRESRRLALNCPRCGDPHRKRALRPREGLLPEPSTRNPAASSLPAGAVPRELSVPSGQVKLLRVAAGPSGTARRARLVVDVHRRRDGGIRRSPSRRAAQVDLLFRLNVFTLQTASSGTNLNIPILASHFAKHAARRRRGFSESSRTRSGAACSLAGSVRE